MSAEVSFERYREAVTAAERLLHLAKAGVRKAVDAAGGIDAAQAAAHGLAWLATYVEALRQMLGWATRLEASSAWRDRAAAARRRLRRVPARRSPAASP